MTPVREPPATLPPNQSPPEGAVILLMKREDGGSFQAVNPFEIRRQLDHSIGRLREAKPIRSGALLLHTHTATQTVLLMKMSTFMGMNVKVEYAERLNTTEGVVRSEMLTSLTNTELLYETMEQGVVRVQRLPSRNIAERGPNPTIKMSFHGKDLPQYLYCGYAKVRVDPWVKPPMQCRKCWAMMSHETRHCRSRHPTCGRCAGQHETDSCEAGDSRCALCDGSHPAWHRRCPAHAEANELHKAETQRAKEKHRAKGDADSRPSPPIWPPSPEEWPIPGGPIVTPAPRPAPSARPRSPVTPAHRPAPSARPMSPGSGPGAKPPAPRPQEVASGSAQGAEPGTPQQGARPKADKKLRRQLDLSDHDPPEAQTHRTETESVNMPTAHAQPRATKTVANPSSPTNSDMSTAELSDTELETTLTDTPIPSKTQLRRSARVRSRASSVASSRTPSPESRAHSPPLSRHLS